MSHWHHQVTVIQVYPYQFVTSKFQFDGSSLPELIWKISQNSQGNTCAGVFFRSFIRNVFYFCTKRSNFNNSFCHMQVFDSVPGRSDQVTVSRTVSGPSDQVTISRTVQEPLDQVTISSTSSLSLVFLQIHHENRRHY